MTMAYGGRTLDPGDLARRQSAREAGGLTIQAERRITTIWRIELGETRSN